jgi:hypothetical protein
MGNGEWGIAGLVIFDRVSYQLLFVIHARYSMPDAQCPISYSSYPILKAASPAGKSSARGIVGNKGIAKTAL